MSYFKHIHQYSCIINYENNYKKIRDAVSLQRVRLRYNYTFTHPMTKTLRTLTVTLTGRTRLYWRHCSLLYSKGRSQPYPSAGEIFPMFSISSWFFSDFPHFVGWFSNACRGLRAVSPLVTLLFIAVSYKTVGKKRNKMFIHFENSSNTVRIHTSPVRK